MEIIIPALILFVMLGSVLLRIRKLVTEIGKDRNPGLVVVGVLGLLMVVCGFLGFVGSSMLSSGLGKHLPGDLELPVERRAEALLDSRKNAYVPLEGKSRMQVYDGNGKFLRGWHYETFGGSAKLWLIGDTVIKVATARKQKLFFYSTRGELLESEDYLPLKYDAFAKPSFSTLERDTPLPLLPFATIAGSWMVGFLGMLLVGGSEYLQKSLRKNKRSPASPK